MYSKRILSVFVVLLILLAGCSGGGDLVSGDSDGANEESPSDDSAGQDQSEGETFDLGDPETTLRDAGSFAVTWRYVGVDRNGVETELNREFYADLRAERSYAVTSSTRDGRSDGGTAEEFVADGITYVRSTSDAEAGYFSYEGSTDVVGTAIALSQARAYGAADDMTYRGTETFDGVTVERYELSEASTALIRAGSVAAVDSPDDFEITDFEYVVLVDEDGLSRYESWSFAGRTSDGETTSGEWSYSLTQVGSTTVEDPDWLTEAKAQTDD